MSNELVEAHPWYEAGLGRPNYRFITVISLPSPGIADSNPMGYINARNSACEAARDFGVGLGSCHFCGESLLHNAIIRNADGGHFVVGLDCAQRSKISQLITAAEKAQRDIARAQQYERERQADAARIAKFQAEKQAQREANGGLTDDELREKQIKEAREVELKAIYAQNAQLISFLHLQSRSSDDFCSSIARHLKTQRLENFSYKVQDIVQDIYVKAQTKGLRGKARDAAQYIAGSEFSLMIGRITADQHARNLDVAAREGRTA